MPIGKMIHAPSRSTSSECLHFLPFRSSARPLVVISHSCWDLTPLSLSAALLFLSDEFNSCRRSTDALSIFPTSGRRRVAFAYRFRWAPPPKAFVLLLSISRALAPRFCPPSDMSLRVIRTADREASPYQSFPPDCTCYGRKLRIIVGGTKIAAAPRVSLKSISSRSLFSPS